VPQDVESSRDKADDSSRPRPRPTHCPPAIAAPAVSVSSPNGKVPKETIYVEEQQPHRKLEETSPGGASLFRVQTALVLQVCLPVPILQGVPVVNVREQEHPIFPDVSFIPSMDSSYNSKMHDLVCISMESMT
jgi:hypothetical protein